MVNMALLRRRDAGRRSAAVGQGANIERRALNAMAGALVMRGRGE